MTKKQQHFRIVQSEDEAIRLSRVLRGTYEPWDGFQGEGFIVWY